MCAENTGAATLREIDYATGCVMDDAKEFNGVPGLATGHGSPHAASWQTPDGLERAPEDSDAFATAWVAPAATVTTSSDGDLWPSSWADNGSLYSACGDGLGFSEDPWSDLVVNRIDGTPEEGLSGTRLASGREVAPVWTDPERHNSKPTGIVAVDGNHDGRDELYLAVQDLRSGGGPDTFNVAPAAGIVSSFDYGRTWHQGNRPMFTDEFTTIIFLDFGRSNSGSTVLRKLDPSAEADPAQFVYAYGLDHNWRTSYSGVVPDPTDLYLARAPIEKIEDRAAWQFYAGMAGRPQDGPRWSCDLGERSAVLTDTRRRGLQQPVPMAPDPVPGTRIAQGGVVYNPGLRRFLCTSWTEHTFEFYESPTPWGPWRHFLTRDFGPYPWTGPRSPHAHHGGYATTIPSKFISPDGRRMWVQSNWFVGSGAYTGSSYGMSMRPMQLTPMPIDNSAITAAGTANLARLPGATPIARASRCGRLEVLNDDRSDRAEDSWNGLHKDDDHWGYTWPEPVRCSRLAYTSGPHDNAGGWFTRTPQVQVRRGSTWETLPVVAATPTYPADFSATGNKSYTFTFAPVVTTGIRLFGPPGGWSRYTAISELAVYDDGENQ